MVTAVERMIVKFYLGYSHTLLLLLLLVVLVCLRAVICMTAGLCSGVQSHSPRSTSV